jgi:hypothetical protein
VLGTGDIIAIVLGSIAVLRWVVDIVVKLRGDDKTEDRIVAAQLTQIKSDLAAHEAADRIEFRWIRESLERVERGVGNVQSQIRFVASHGPGRIVELGKDDTQ